MPTLLQSIQQSDITALQELLQSDVDVNQPCSNGELPLKIAVQQLFYGDVDVAKATQVIDLLLAAGADPNKVLFKIGYREETESLLHFLCRQGKSETNFFDKLLHGDQKKDPAKQTLQVKHRELALELIKKLFAAKHKIDLNSRNKNNETPLYCAVDSSNIPLARWLLGNGAKADTRDLYGRTVLHVAVDGEVETTLIDTLLEQKLDINAVDNNGDMPLDTVQNPDLILFLLKRGAKTKRLGRDCLSFFHIAQQHNHTALIDYLFTQGLATYCNQYHKTALHQTDDYELLARLLKNGAGKNLQGQIFFDLFDHWFAAFRPITDGRKTQRHLELLREYKADFCVIDKDNNTLLHNHFWNGITLCQFLLNNGVAINAQNKTKQTVLHKAVNIFHSDCFALLLAKSADATLLDGNGLTALEYIKYSFVYGGDFNTKQAITILTQLLAKYPAQKCPANAADLLLIAVHCDHLPFIKDLHARGASLWEKSKNDWPVSQLMVQQNRVELMQWMLTTLKAHPQRAQVLIDLLFEAVKSYRPEMIKLFIQEGVEFTKLNGKGENILGMFVESLAGNPMDTREPQQYAKDAEQTFSILLESKLDVNQKNRRGQTALQQLLERYREHCWSWAKALLDKGAVIPSGFQYFHCLAIMAATNRDDKTLADIVQQCPQQNKSLLLAQLARFAIAKVDTALLDQLQKLGLKFNEPLLDTANNTKRYLIDAVLTPTHSFINFGRDEKEPDAAQREINQQKVLVYFLKQNTPLHYPMVKESYPPAQSVLHVAAERGWVEVLTLLLQPACGFRVDQCQASFERETPLQLAVKNRRLAAAQFLIQQGANPLVKTREGKTLLHIACKNGDIVMVEWLLSLKKIDIAVHSAEGFFSSSAVQVAAYYQDKTIAGQLVELFIAQGAPVDVWLLILLISQQLPETLLHKVLAKLSDQVLLENRLLHHAVAANYVLACQLLLKRCPALIKTINTRGRTPLHLATVPDRQAIFALLQRAGADPLQRDYEGYDVNTHALCHGTASDQKNSIDSSAFKQLRASLLEEKEFASGNQEALFSLSLYCFNLINLFTTKEAALRYIQTHRSAQSRQPIHDLCQFQLPVVHTAWTKKFWADLLLKHGLKAAEYLPWAARIEQILQRAPRSWEEIVATAKQITYARETEHPPMAQLFKEHKVPEAAFNRVLAVYPKDEKRQHHLPDIYIDGKEFKQEQYYLKKLPPQDLRGFILGKFTRCCQLVGGQGEACAMHGMLSPYGGFYVIFERQQDMTAYRNIREAISLKKFLQSFQEKSRRQKYRQICNDIKTELQRDQKNTITDDLILKTLRVRLTKNLPKDSPNDEIVAQSWAWISQQGSLILDSWERTQARYDVLCIPFLEKLAEQAVNKYGFKCVLLGKGGQTPADLKLDTLKQAETPRDYFDYRDSQEQYVMRAREPVHTKTATIANASFFKTAVLTSDNPGFSLTEMDNLLGKELTMQPRIQLFSAMDLTRRDEKQIGKHLREATSVEQWQRQGKSMCILPFLTREYFWTALIVEAIESTTKDKQFLFTYLDFAARRLPEEISFYQAGITTTQINTLPVVYNEDATQSGIWLLETLRHIAATGRITIPVQNIIYKRAETIMTILNAAGLRLENSSNPIGLVLEYSDLPVLKFN
jgi:ankyrin repeat protein